MNLEWGRAICYSGYREGQSPNAKKYPTDEQVKEDLDIIVKAGFKYIRMYDPVDHAVSVCRTIRQYKLPLQLMLGPGCINEEHNKGCTWATTSYTEEQLKERAAFNDSRIDALIEIANEYSDIVFCVSVGNENTPDWGENTVSEDRLVEFAIKLKEKTGKPVTFNEGAKEWQRLPKLAQQVDLISIHSYALWYGNKIEEAIEANQRDFNKIKELYPNKPVIFSEVGWATKSSPKNAEMRQEQPSEENQARYYKEFWDWTDSQKIVAFMFEAFDEPWKGGSDPDEAEKHWGIYYENRQPKLVAKSL